MRSLALKELLIVPGRLYLFTKTMAGNFVNLVKNMMMCAVWVYTNEDIKALMVGPIRVLMLICFRSSPHIVRHLRRVSGSF